MKFRYLFVAAVVFALANAAPVFDSDATSTGDISKRL